MYTLVHHTADVRFHVVSPTLEGLFADALRALTEFMQPEWTGEPVSATIEVDANDATSLLIDFLSEALTRSHVHHEAYTAVTFAALTTGALHATLTGRRVEAFGEDVKAVTYHEAEVLNEAGEWRTMLVFDI